jgi:drug/metabolite transporter (DMT)-like permease
MTAILAALFLNERSLRPTKILSYVMGIAGLLVMFNSALEFSPQAIQGMLAILIATLLYAVSSVWVKQIDAKLPALTQISGGMLLALPAYLVTWYFLDDHHIPETMSQQTRLAILYLGVIATPIGFALYYYVLIYLSATKVALITLITPVFSLFLGYTVNHEPLTLKIAAGAGLIIMALAIHSLADRRASSA